MESMGCGARAHRQASTRDWQRAGRVELPVDGSLRRPEDSRRRYARVRACRNRPSPDLNRRPRGGEEDGRRSARNCPVNSRRHGTGLRPHRDCHGRGRSRMHRRRAGNGPTDRRFIRPRPSGRRDRSARVIGRRIQRSLEGARSGALVNIAKIRVRDGDVAVAAQPIALAVEAAGAIADTSERALAFTEIAEIQLDCIKGSGAG